MFEGSPERWLLDHHTIHSALKRLRIEGAIELPEVGVHILKSIQEFSAAQLHVVEAHSRLHASERIGVLETAGRRRRSGHDRDQRRFR